MARFGFAVIPTALPLMAGDDLVSGASWITRSLSRFFQLGCTTGLGTAKTGPDAVR